MRTLIKVICIVMALGVAAFSFLPLHKSEAQDDPRTAKTIQAAVDNALARCDTQREYPQKMEYTERLKSILARASISAVEELNARAVTICLDQRLSARGFKIFDKSIMGIYYPRATIVTIWDDGEASHYDSWFDPYTAKRASTVIDTLPVALNDVKTSIIYASPEGTDKAYRTSWFSTEDYNSSQLSNIPGVPLGR